VKIWIAPYTLKARTSLGAKAKSSERSGALLKVEIADGVGYSDLHPWQELGDLPLSDQLNSLKTSVPSKQAQRSLALAEFDRSARSKGISAFNGLVIPRVIFW
jgi:O-succinylbenzoate synthase